MDEVERPVVADLMIKGIWQKVPKYSNPPGCF
jgi:hypothetical protein